MDGLVNLLRSLGSTRIIIMGVVTAALIGFFAFLTVQVTTPPMSLLYSDLDVKDSGAITEKLSSMGVEYKVSPDGTSIMVPEGEAARLRMSMAQDGLPSGGSIGYEIFDEGNSLGTTSFVQNINHLRALEGELSRSIQSIDRVAAARVHLVLPERQLFSREERKPSASIVIRSQGRLSSSQVNAIQHLVAAAVPNLDPGRISIVDERGTLLAAGIEGSKDGVFSANADERRMEYENQLKSELEALLANSLGPGKVRAEVTAQIDFDRITTNSEIYDPDSQVVRSSQTVEETGTNTERAGTGNTTSVANNLPEADAPAEDQPTNASSNARTEETVNYEISKTIRTQVQEAGRIKRLSVAILVDGRYQQNEDGTTTYEPRSQEELDKIATLVRSAIGYDEQRGDVVNVVNMQFAQVEPIAEAEPEAADILGIKRSDFFRLAQLIVMAVVAALVILLVVRPLLVRVLESLPPPQPAGAKGLPGGRTPALPGAEGGMMPGQLAYHGDGDEDAQGGGLVPAGGMAMAQALGNGSFDISQIDGQMQENAINKLGEVVTRHPDEATSIIRNWLYNG